MAHVFRIEAVVTKLVHYDFICREVICDVERIETEIDRASFQKFFDTQKECRLAYLVPMRSVLEMADGTDCDSQAAGRPVRGTGNRVFWQKKIKKGMKKECRRSW